MSIQRYTPKIIEVEAVKFDGTNFAEIEEFVGDYLDLRLVSKRIKVSKNAKHWEVYSGDFFVKREGIDGVTTFRAKQFLATHELAPVNTQHQGKNKI